MTDYNDFPYYNTKYKKIIFGEPEAGLLREKRRSGLQEMLLSRTIK